MSSSHIEEELVSVRFLLIFYLHVCLASVSETFMPTYTPINSEGGLPEFPAEVCKRAQTELALFTLWCKEWDYFVT